MSNCCQFFEYSLGISVSGLFCSVWEFESGEYDGNKVFRIITLNLKLLISNLCYLLPVTCYLTSFNKLYRYFTILQTLLGIIVDFSSIQHHKIEEYEKVIANSRRNRNICSELWNQRIDNVNE